VTDLRSNSSNKKAFGDADLEELQTSSVYVVVEVTGVLFPGASTVIDSAVICLNL
jgi:hypothetical protein